MLKIFFIFNSNHKQKICYSNNHNFINYLSNLEAPQLLMRYQLYFSNSHTHTKRSKPSHPHFPLIYGTITSN
jgi:hypothetical protein